MCPQVWGIAAGASSAHRWPGTPLHPPPLPAGPGSPPNRDACRRPSPLGSRARRPSALTPIAPELRASAIGPEVISATLIDRPAGRRSVAIRRPGWTAGRIEPQMGAEDIQLTVEILNAPRKAPQTCGPAGSTPALHDPVGLLDDLEDLRPQSEEGLRVAPRPGWAARGSCADPNRPPRAPARLARARGTSRRGDRSPPRRRDAWAQCRPPQTPSASWEAHPARRRRSRAAPSGRSPVRTPLPARRRRTRPS